MSNMSKKDTEKLKELIHSNDVMRISCISKGFNSGDIVMAPCIFIGPKNKTILLWHNEITIYILKMLMDKALLDNNNNAASALLLYASINKKRFWAKYKNTDLGLKLMADMLSSNDQ